ncbi:unnamed protein product [Cercospora beticola]|nr:unnamed protein product [Cercospora beticola]
MRYPDHPNHTAACPPSKAMMAAARLRRTFRYPSEDDDNEPEDLDEEHQEKLIADLEAEDSAKNELYRKAFLGIPFIASLVFLYTFVTASSARQRLIAILGVSSLACTAYVLHFMPIEKPERKGKRAVYRVEAEKSPVEKYLVYLNAGLAALLELAAFVSWRQGRLDDAWRESLPAIIMGLTMFVRQQLAPLDLEELQKARYELKGA